MKFNDLNIVSDYSEGKSIQGVNVPLQDGKMPPMDEIQKKMEENKPLIERLGYHPVIVFCLFDKMYSQAFFQCWARSLAYLAKQEVEFIVGTAMSDNPCVAKNLCIGGDMTKGKKQKLFQDSFDFTHLLFIDSSAIWSPENLRDLLVRNVDVVSGIFSLNANSIGAVKNINYDAFKEKSFDCIPKTEIKDQKNLIEVDYTMMNFFLIKKNVFSNLEYPWFKTEILKIDDDIQDVMSDEFCFCRDLKKNGYKIYIDPTVVIGNQQLLVI